MSERYKLTIEVGGDVPDRLIAAAEILFAAKGLNVPLRELTREAGVSLPAVNYHFGSKDGLAEAVFIRLTERVNRRRLQALDACLSAARKRNRPPRLDDIISSFIQPYVDPEQRNSGLLLSRFILQHRLYPTPLTAKITVEHFNPLADRYIEALLLACPGAERTDICWRYMFMLNAIVMTVADDCVENRVSQLSLGAADGRDKNALKAHLLSFLRKGLAL